MKSPGDSGSASSAKARTPPQWAWPSTTMCFTRSAPTPNSSAAETPCALPVRRVGRHDVGDVAHDEQLARAGVEDHLRRDARIAAADHHDLRRLAALRPARGSGPAPAAAGRRRRRCSHRSNVAESSSLSLRCALPNLLAIRRSQANVMPEIATFTPAGLPFYDIPPPEPAAYSLLVQVQSTTEG